MPRLSEDQCRTAHLAPPGKTSKLNDGDGLFLLCTDRAKGWRFRYKNGAGKDSLLSLGVYPGVSLLQARAAALDYRSKLGRGESLVDVRRKERSDTDLESTTFGQAAAEYNARRGAGLDPKDKGVVPDKKTLERCRLNLRHTSKLHRRTFAEIKRPDIINLCMALGGHRDTASRVGMYVSAVFRYAYSKGYFTGVDPTHQGGTIGQDLPTAPSDNYPAVTDSKGVGALMSVVDGSEWLISPGVSRALQVLARTATRAGNVQEAEWSEFDLDGSWPQHDGHPTWVIPRAKLKSGRTARDRKRADHIVPLSTQTVAILRRQHELTGHLKWVFPGARSDAVHISDAAMSAAMMSLGYKDQHVPHGYRRTFGTLTRDVLKADSEVVNRQLAHMVGTEADRAYDSAQRLDDRRALMQSYSDLLDRLRDGKAAK